MKFLFTILFALNTNYLFSEIETQQIQFHKPFITSLDQDALVFNINLTPQSLEVNKIYTGKPSANTLIKLRHPVVTDRFVIKILDKDKNEQIMLGLGNPFYVSAQHIGYEDSRVSGGMVSSANIEIAIPINITPKYFIISERNSIGVLEDIQQIELQ